MELDHARPLDIKTWSVFWTDKGNVVLTALMHFPITLCYLCAFIYSLSIKQSNSGFKSSILKSAKNCIDVSCFST